MAAIHETAYPRIKPNLNHKEFKEIFEPTEEELLFLDSKTKKTLHISRLGFMMILKCYQYLGRPVKVGKIDELIKIYIAEKIGAPATLDLKDYKRKTRERHIEIIREYLEINTNKNARRKVMKKAAMDAAATRENLADIINVILEELINGRFELPAFKRLIRLARAARTVVNNHNYSEIEAQLSEDQKKIIDEMFGIIKANDENIDHLYWFMLKKEPKKPTSKNIKEFIAHVNKIKSIRQKININLYFIVPARLEQLRDEAMIADLDDMKRMRPIKRYALATILIYMKSSSVIDDLVQVFIIWIRKIEAQSRSNLEKYRLEQAKTTDEFVLLFYNTLLALKNNETAADKILEIEKQLDGKIDNLIEQCREHLQLTGENHIDWMKRPYCNKRYIIFQLLETLTILSSTNDKSIENALRYIMNYRHSHKQWIEISNSQETIQPELSILSDGWFKFVTGLNKDAEIRKINRHNYEIAVLTLLKNELCCADAYVEGAFIYDDQNKQFITWDEFDLFLDTYCDLTGLPKEPGRFVTEKQSLLRETAKKVDENYHNNPYLIIEDGLPILKKTPAKKEHQDVDKVKKMIMDQMPIVNIVDVIVDVENWLKLSAHFNPLSGYETKIKDYPSRFVATALSYGCNMGPTQTERSLSIFSRKQISWIFNHHATEQKLIKSLRKIINHYNLFDLPKHWGSGDSVSVDGTFWDMYKQNLLAAHHIRYGKYGGVGYYHVSDKYIALVSNLISCGAHESIYLLNCVGENDSDIQPNKVHGDSWAQSEVLFGISALLKIMLMPRIKNFKHLNYYKAAASDHYENIDELFTEKPSDWDFIETHYYDMLRVAISIYKGKVKASTILHRLCSKSRKNKLYFAFRELGRVERTIFLLNYINDLDLRRMIQAATCKSEEFNQFISWVRFGDGGVIGDNLRFNQQKIIKFNHLLANMLIFHTVVNQTKVINKLRSQGIEIPNEILPYIAPYWTEHFNRFGAFYLNIDKSTVNIEYDLKNI